MTSDWKEVALSCQNFPKTLVKFSTLENFKFPSIFTWGEIDANRDDFRQIFEMWLDRGSKP